MRLRRPEARPGTMCCPSKSMLCLDHQYRLKDELLNQFKADACQRPALAGPVEATVLGNVLLQARACGELRAIVRHSSDLRPFEPKRAKAAAWEEARARFDRLLARAQKKQ